LGDVAVGLLAAAIGIGATGGRQLNPRTVLRWNLLGIADLIVALSTGFLTTPSAFQMFAFEHPNELISMFPLVLIPTFLVPLAILLHIISLIQLRRATAHDSDWSSSSRTKAEQGHPAGTRGRSGRDRVFVKGAADNP
jgi:hypothetical protein